MNYRRLGRTNLRVSVIGFGALFLDRCGPEQAIAVVRAAVERGVNLFQCGHEWGSNEQFLARALSDGLRHHADGPRHDTDGPRHHADGLRDRILLCGLTEGADTSRGYEEQVERGLRAYGTDHFDAYFLGNVSTKERFRKVFGPGGGLEGLKRAKQEGKIRHVAASSHGGPDLIGEIIASGEIEILMVSYNAARFHRESGHAPVEDIAAIEREILPLAAERDIGVLAMKPLGGGLLSSRIEDPALRAMVPNPPPIPASLALRFVLERREIAAAVVGMAGPREVGENCDAGDDLRALSDDERRALRQAVEGLAHDYCRACHHCERRCPEQIPIGAIFQFEALLGSPMNLAWVRGAYRGLQHPADACNACGKCEEDCPYGIPIVSGLKRAHLALRTHPEGSAVGRVSAPPDE